MPRHLPRIKARVALHAHRRVRGLLQGEYAAFALGRSLDFHDLREYVRGDDLRDLDWRASARTGRMLVRRFTATRKHHVLLVVSTGRTMAAVNDDLAPKRELGVFVAGLVGWLALRHGDLVAVAYGDADGQHVLPATGQEARLELALDAVDRATTPASADADLVGLLQHVVRVVRRRTILLVVSDTLQVSAELAAVLRRLQAQHEVLFVTIADLDPTSLDPTRATAAALTDIGSGDPIPDWSRGDPRLAAEFTDLLTDEHTARRDACAQLGIAHEQVTDHDSAIRAVFRLLERHRHAPRR